MATLAEHIAEPPIPYTTEVLPPVLHRTSEQPPLFDGATRLYICYKCPFSQRVWMARNYKGLQDKIQLVAINSWNRPPWYREKVYGYDKVPALEHKNDVHGDSMDLLEYLDKHFSGPSLQPKTAKQKIFADEISCNVDEFMKTIHSSFTRDPKDEVEESFEYLDEYCLKRYDNGPFFLGDQFSYVDIAFAPFIDRFHLFLQEQFNYDILKGKPRLTKWLEEMNKMECFKETKCDPKVVCDTYRARYITLKW